MTDNQLPHKINDIVNNALEDSEIVQDKKLYSLLIRIKEVSDKGEIFYDYKKEVQPAVSMYTINHQFRTPKVLLDLLSLIPTPKAWSGL